VSLKEIEQEAIGLPVGDRARLIQKLLDSLPGDDSDVSDEEISEREKHLNDGTVEPISHEEFVHRVRKKRGR
jgi:putative addiction module component (TIGR02574 family)